MKANSMSSSPESQPKEYDHIAPHSVPPIAAGHVGLTIQRILYCHGFGSNFDPQKDKVKLLSSLAPVDGITVDYTLPPDKVFAAFAGAIQQQHNTLIVGTSMGGFFAAWLGSTLALPFIAINPAVAPENSLRKHIGTGRTYFGTPFNLTHEVVQAYANLPFRLDGTGEIVLDLGDEVLDALETIAMVGDRLPVTTFEGGSHRFDHLPELVSHIRAKYDF